MKKEIIKKVSETIKRHRLIEKGDHIVLGLSGGPDSVCLFSVLTELSQELEITMEAVHVNHMFRDKEAEHDALYSQHLCDVNGIKCHQFKRDCIKMAAEEKLTVEEAGRKVRYEAFDIVASEADRPVKIAVAQNADDQYETMLFRLIRGTGPDGLGAMDYIRKSDMGFDIIRPLLDIEKKDIKEYCLEKGLDPCVDYTNEDDRYTRNSIRLNLIPYIEENYNPSFKKSLGRLSLLLSEDRDYMAEETKKAMSSCVSEGVVDLNRYRTLHRSIRTRILMRLMADAGLSEDVSMAHIGAADELAMVKRASGAYDLPGGYMVNVSYDSLKIRKPGEKLQGEERKVSASFDRDEIKKVYGDMEPVLRTRQPGDYIHVGTGRKKIQDLFVDLKIPKEKRDSIKVLALGSEIIWVLGYRYSSRFKVQDSTKNILKVETIVII